MRLTTLIFLWILYFLQGIPYGYQTKFLPVFLRSISVSLSWISLTAFSLSLPWILKPIWAPLVDHFGSKFSWIVLNLVGMAFLYLIASLITLKSLLLTLFILGGLNILSATQDIAVDSIIIDLRSVDEIGFGNIAQVVGYKSGSLIGGGLLGWLSSSFSWQFLFFMLFLTYAFPTVVCVAFFSKLTPAAQTQTVSHLQQKNGFSILQNNTRTKGEWKDTHQRQTKTANSDRNHMLGQYYRIYRDILVSPGTKWIIIYVLIYKLGEQGIISLFPMCLMDQGLLPSEVAVLTGLWCQSCSIFGSLLGGVIVRSQQWSGLCNVLNKLSIARLFVAVMLTWLGSAVNTNWFSVVLFDCILHGISGTITTVTFTLMVTCSQGCPKTISATHYSTLTTFEVVGKLTMVAISGSIVEAIGYNVFFIICVSLLVLPIILLRIPAHYVDYRSKVEL